MHRSVSLRSLETYFFVEDPGLLVSDVSAVSDDDCFPYNFRKYSAAILLHSFASCLSDSISSGLNCRVVGNVSAFEADGFEDTEPVFFFDFSFVLMASNHLVTPIDFTFY